jgi:hypothetical protein
VGTNRALIIGGAVLLGLMMLVAAFALGVYLGAHGLTREGLVYAVPGGGAQPGPGGAPQPPEGPGRPGGAAPLPLDPPPQLIGRVRRVSDEGLELATPDGPRWVALAEEVSLEDIEGKPLSLDEVKPGTVIGVYGEFSPNGGPEMIATRLVLLPAQSPPR